MSPAVGTAERLRQTERVVAFIRLFVVLFNVVTFLTMAPDEARTDLANVIIVLALIYAFVSVAYQPPVSHSTALALTTTIVDNILIGVWLHATGGFESPYYPLFYAESAASIGRFGFLVGNISSVAGAGIYLVVVAIDDFSGSNYELAARIGYIFVIAAFVSYIVDISRRSEREVAIAEEQATALRELDRLRTTFVTNISHELRTPLTAIRGASATLGRHDITEDQSKTLVEMIDRQSKRLAALVQDIIDIGLEEQGKFVPHFEDANLAMVVATQVMEWRERTGRRIDLAPADDEILARCDSAKLGNALGKLLDNAVKFSPSGTTISVGVEGSGDEAMIWVQDEGVGIDSTDLQMIFQKFHQVDGSHTRQAGGTGIGLSIAKTVVELHGGRIDVSSEPGRGARFTIVLPRDGGSEQHFEALLKGSPSA